MAQTLGGSPRLIASSLALNGGAVVVAGFGIVFQLMAARGLGPLGYGAFAASFAYVTLWVLLMDGGIGVALTREAAADRRRLAWVGPLTRWRMLLGLVGAAGAVASAWALRLPPAVVGLIAIMTVGMIASSAMRLAFAIFRVVGWFVREAALATLQRLTLVVLAAAALWLGAGPAGVATAFTLSLLLGALPAAAWARRAVASAVTSLPRVPGPPAGFFLKTCLPLLAIDLLTGLYFKADQILLLRLRGPEETGLYAVAFRVLEALLLLVGGIMTVLFPRLAAAARGAPGAFRADLVQAWRALWVGGVVVAVNGWLWAVPLLPVVFGDAYVSAEPSLRVLLLALPLACVNYLLTQSLLAAGHERYSAVGAAVCALVNVGLNVLVIPGRGAIGAAWATVVTEGVLFVVCLIGLREFGNIIPRTSTLVTGVAAGLAVAIGWWALPDQPVERGLLALAVSVACWETATPWPLWKLWALAGRRER